MESDMSAQSPEHASIERKHPTKSNPPTLREIASRFNMLPSDATSSSSSASTLSKDQNPAGTCGRHSLTVAQSLKRLGLAGRLEPSAYSANKPAAGQTKSLNMPSLNDIRARLNQRGVDITSSAWSPKKQKNTSSVGSETSLSPTKEKGISKMETLGRAEVEGHMSTQPLEQSKPSKPLQPLHSSETSTSSSASSEPDPTVQRGSGVVADSFARVSVTRTGREAAMEAKHGVKHPLENEWTLYYDLQKLHGSASSDQYEATLKRVGHFTTLESFFDTFATLHRPSRLEKNSNYHFFKNGVKPLWEDPENASGGRWVITLRDRGQTAGSRAGHEALLDRSWMWLVLALIGETLEENDLVTGAVCSLRGKGDRITVWTRRKEPVDEINSLGQRLLELLELQDEPGIQMDFSVNSGTKESQQQSYMRKHLTSHAPSAQKQFLQEPQSRESTLGTWLDTNATLHPADHVRYYAHQLHSNDQPK